LPNFERRLSKTRTNIPSKSIPDDGTLREP